MRAALVTCSYRPDLEPFRDLAASIDRHATGAAEHLVIVPRRDLSLFAPLAGPRRRVVAAEALIGRFVRYVPLHPKLWLTPRLKPVRGWLIQQLLKLAAADATDADVLVHVDSDVVLVAPFTIDRVAHGDRVRLWHEPGGGTLDTHRRWHATAASLLGLPPCDYHGADYIHQLVSWHAPTVRRMRTRIEAVAGRPWQEALIAAHDVAEYILYGVYVDAVLGGRDHVHDPVERCLCSWSFDLTRPSGLDAFRAGLRPHHAAVLIQSTERMPIDRRRALIASIGRGDAPLPVVEPCRRLTGSGR